MPGEDVGEDEDVEGDEIEKMDDVEEVDRMNDKIDEEEVEVDEEEMEGDGDGRREKVGKNGKKFKKRGSRRARVAAVLVILLILIPGLVVAGLLASIKDPEVDVAGIKLKHYDPTEGSITFIVTMEVFNPNLLGGNLESIDVDVFLNDDYIGKVDQEVNKHIEARGITLVDIDFVLESLPSKINILSIMIKIEGTVTVGVFGFSFIKEVEEEDEIFGFLS